MEKWRKWIPHGVKCQTRMLERITFADKDEIVLSDYAKENRISILFRALSFSCTSSAYLTTSVLSKSAEFPKGFFTDWNLFVVEESEFIKQVNSDSEGLLLQISGSVFHYCILTEDMVIHILCSREPKVVVS